MSNSIYGDINVAGLDIEIGKNELIEAAYISDHFMVVCVSDYGYFKR